MENKNNMTIEELINKRKEAFRINIENGFNFDDILVNTYKDSLHFIFELIQNSEDAGAENIYIELKDDYVLFNHDSRNDFTISDINSITGIGCSTKKNQLNKIGKFGIGFKSVFTVTDSPYIFSGDFNISISNYYVPKLIDSYDRYFKIAQRFNGTTIILPFNHKILSAEESCSLVMQSLEKLSDVSILFLENIKSIEWNYKNEKHILKKNYMENDHKEFFKKVCIEKNSSEINCLNEHESEYIEEEKSHYLYFSRKLEFNNNFSCAVAYKADLNEDNSLTIVSAENTKLSVFLPTEFLTDLNFYVHAPFRTTPSRESIPEKDSDNVNIVNELAELYEDSILFLGEKAYINEEFLNMLPLNELRRSCNFVYCALFDKTVRIMKEEKVIPSSEGEYACLNDCAIAYNMSISELLKENELYIMSGRKHWLSSRMSYRLNNNIFNFIKSTGMVPEIRVKDIINKINSDYLRQLSDERLSQLYSFLLHNETDLKCIKTMPVIKCNDGSFKAAYGYNGNNNYYYRNVYLPGIDMNDSRIINIELLKYDGTLELIEKLNIREAYKADNVKIMLDNFRDRHKFKSLEEYSFYFKNFIKSYSELDEKGKETLTEKVNIFYVPVETTYKDIMWWSDAQYENVVDVYLKTAHLLILFDENKEIRFADLSFLNDFELKNEAYEFLRKAGIKVQLKKVRVQALSNEEKLKLTNNIKIKGRNKFEENYSICGLTYILETMTKEKSLILWDYLREMNEEDFFGTFTWYYCGLPNTEKIQSDFLKKLTENKWIYDSRGNVYYPSEIFQEQMAEEYEKNEVLRKVLKIKKLKNGLSYEEYMEIVRLNNMDEDAQKQFLNDKYEKDIIEVDAEEVYSRFNNDILQLCSDDDYEQENNEDEKSLIGLWGERFVFNSFIKKYEDEGVIITSKEDKDCYMTDNEGNTIKISLMDRDGKCNEGYDISITVNDDICEYIEVKSKSKNSSNPFSVSNSQWKMATRLFGENCGEKYSLCFVINAGTKKAEIIYKNNPIKRWIDGEIRIRKIEVK